MSPASYQTAPPRDGSSAFSGSVRYSTKPGACAPVRAGNGTRTRDPNLGKVVLYQLSYSRKAVRILAPGPPRRNDPQADLARPKRGSGGEGDRTPDLVNAIHALSQLSYAPAYIVPPSNGAVASTET
jgi:hypothetical protein